MSKTYKVRNPYAQALREDERYRPKKVISKKFKEDKHKMTKTNVFEKEEFDSED